MSSVKGKQTVSLFFVFGNNISNWRSEHQATERAIYKFLFLSVSIKLALSIMDCRQFFIGQGIHFIHRRYIGSEISLSKELGFT